MAFDVRTLRIVHARVSQPEPSTPLGDQGTTSRGLYETALPWYCKTLLMSRGPQVLTVLGRGPQTMKGWESLLYAVVGHGRVRNPVLVGVVHAIYGIFYAIHATSGRTKSFFEVWTEVTTHLRWRFYFMVKHGHPLAADKVLCMDGRRVLAQGSIAVARAWRAVTWSTNVGYLHMDWRPNSALLFALCASALDRTDMSWCE